MEEGTTRVIMSFIIVLVLDSFFCSFPSLIYQKRRNYKGLTSFLFGSECIVFLVILWKIIIFA